MLGGSDVSGMLTLLDSIESYGLDCMSAGVVLAWATEIFDKGIISERETNGIRLTWGDYTSYLKALSFIVEQPTDFYVALSKGVDHASAIYGGQEYALAFGGNEMPGYHTGPACHISYLAGARHSHLDGAGYAVDKKVMVNKAMTPEMVASEIIAEERWRQILSSLVICFFARDLYTPEVIVEALRLSGFDLSEEALRKVGEEIHTEKFRFKFREGFSFDALRVPKRIFETRSAAGMIDEQFIKTAMEYVKNEIISKVGK
jgi:aldehyde:ferredoxin oxidoreductase